MLCTKLRLKLLSVALCFSCGDYLDIVPDQVASLDHVFTTSLQARKYLFTCYSYSPLKATGGIPLGFGAGGEIWTIDRKHFQENEGVIKSVGEQDPDFNYSGYVRRATRIVGANNSIRQVNVRPLGADFWSKSERSLYRGIRTCHTLIDRVDEVPDLSEADKLRWKSEAAFLAAYYHYYLFRLYGPIPLAKYAPPVGSDLEAIKLPRQPIDSCVNYIASQLDLSIENLPEGVPADELGRITKPIALAVKAKLLIFAASPLFNGNPRYAQVSNTDGTLLFPSEPDPEKWKRAADACLEAILSAESAGHKLLESGDLGFKYIGADIPVFQQRLTLRSRVTAERNIESVWTIPGFQFSGIQSNLLPFLIKPPFNFSGRFTTNPILFTGIETAERYYSKHGVPISEDKAWENVDWFKLRTAVENDSAAIMPKEQTVQLNFDREPRFYADLGFDRGAYIGINNENYDSKQLMYVQARGVEASGVKGKSRRSPYIPGYYIKKLVNYQTMNFIESTNIGVNSKPTYQSTNYLLPLIRLADLYLLYAEALNEHSGPNAESIEYLDRIRTRAGLEGVKESWENYSNDPAKPTTIEGLREIIRRERSIELAFEGQRYWDLRRWRESIAEINAKPLKGWSLVKDGKALSEASEYYVPRTIFIGRFSLRDYLLPISLEVLFTNDNLVQNPGWN